MGTVTIYGASDDLIEVDGAIREEFSAYGEWRYLHFDDGTVIRGGYGLVPNRGWHFEVVRRGTAAIEVLEPICDNGGHYTDQMRLTGVASVECWSGPDGPTRADLVAFFENLDARDYTDAALLAAYRALGGEQ